MEVIVDLQGFKKDFNEFVPKEFAVTSAGPNVEGEVQQRCIMFDEPCALGDLPEKYRRINTWLTSHYHGIPWDVLWDTVFEDPEEFIQEALVGVTRVYVKGREKVEWLKKLLRTTQPLIENLEDLGCPRLEDLKEGENCSQHRYLTRGSDKYYHCALRNVVNLKIWLAKYTSGCMEKSLKNFCEIRDLNLMSPEDIKHLPKYFILAFASDGVDAAWDSLPSALQKDPEVLGYRRCREHWSPAEGDQLDGPLPLIKDCALCQLYN